MSVIRKERIKYRCYDDGAHIIYKDIMCVHGREYRHCRICMYEYIVEEPYQLILCVHGKRPSLCIHCNPRVGSVHNKTRELEIDVELLKKQLEILKKENEDMKEHIKLQPDGEAYFKLMKDFESKKLTLGPLVPRDLKDEKSLMDSKKD